MINPLLPMRIGNDDRHEVVWAELTHWLSLYENLVQRQQYVNVEVKDSPFVSSVLFVLLRRLAELRTQGQPPQQHIFLCPKIRPVPKLGPSARGPP